MEKKLWRKHDINWWDKKVLDDGRNNLGIDKQKKAMEWKINEQKWIC